MRVGARETGGEVSPARATCGTVWGLQVHRNNGEETCSGCRAAAAERQRHWRAQAKDSLGRRIAERQRHLTLEASTVDQKWRLDAACRTADPGLFHSDVPSEIRLALGFCANCPVTEECLAEQQLIGAPGVWGGVRWIPRANGVGADLDYARMML